MPVTTLGKAVTTMSQIQRKKFPKVAGTSKVGEGHQLENQTQERHSTSAEGLKRWQSRMSPTIRVK